MSMHASKEIWTVIEALDWTIGYLGRKGDENPRLSSEWLMSAATGMSRVQIYTDFDRPLTLDERAALREAVKRRAAGEPLQYVTGETAFRHIILKVRDGVLIPRPETEVTVECALEALDVIGDERGIDTRSFHAGRQRLVQMDDDTLVDDRDLDDTPHRSPSDYPFQVLDLCTGSGCIALSIVQENPAVYVNAVDIDAKAVTLARENARTLRLQDRLSVWEGDLYAGIHFKKDESPSLASIPERFDLIVANPPYIPTAIMSQLPNEVVGFEPYLALDGGDDGLDIYRRILVDAVAHLAPDGAFVCELHETCLQEAADLARASFSRVNIRNDLAGKNRIIIAYRS